MAFGLILLYLGWCGFEVVESMGPVQGAAPELERRLERVQERLRVTLALNRREAEFADGAAAAAVREERLRRVMGEADVAFDAPPAAAWHLSNSREALKGPEPEKAASRALAEISAAIEALGLQPAEVVEQERRKNLQYLMFSAGYALLVLALLARKSEMERHRKRWVGEVAEGIGGPLTVINGYCDLLLETLPEGDPLRGELRQIGQAGAEAVAALEGHWQKA